MGKGIFYIRPGHSQLKTTGDFLEKIAYTNPDGTEEFSGEKQSNYTDEDRLNSIMALFEFVKHRKEMEEEDRKKLSQN